MANNRFRARMGRAGIQCTHLQMGNPGALAPVAVASSTVIYRVGTPKGRSYVENISIQIGTLPTGSAAITAQVFRRNSVGSVNQALTGTFDLKAGTAADTVANIPITATDNQRTKQDGEYFAVDIVAAGTITLQPSNLFVTIEAAVLE